MTSCVAQIVGIHGPKNLIGGNAVIESIHQSDKKGFTPDLIEERFIHLVTLSAPLRMGVRSIAGVAQW